jgi:hypothetical protein
VAGFKKYPDHNIFVLGWCGQAAACGYAFQVLADELNDPDALRMVQKSLDFVATTEFHDQGFCTWYRADEGRWVRGGNPELLSQGQAMLNVANAVRVGRRSNLDVTRWEAFLRRAGDFHARRILSDTWHPVSTDQAFFIAPLCEAYRLFGVEEYREAALKAGEVYASRHVNMREPYWSGTLDASCEDKEGAFAALQGFLALYELTGRREHLLWAAHAGDVALTYLVVWDIDLPPGRLRDHNFKTRGWTAVSVQNQHIDVFGVLIAPDIYRLGRYLERDDLKKAALLMVRSCGQLIDPFGSQGEQPHQTNYAQHGDFRRQLEAGDITGVRGNYVEQWTVFWITAHFLNAAAQFKELGVPIGTDDSAAALPPADPPAASAQLQEGAIGIMLGSIPMPIPGPSPGGDLCTGQRDRWIQRHPLARRPHGPHGLVSGGSWRAPAHPPDRSPFCGTDRRSCLSSRNVRRRVGLGNLRRASENEQGGGLRCSKSSARPRSRARKRFISGWLHGFRIRRASLLND